MENNSSNRFNLENHEKKDLFTVPDHYFKELPSRILGRVNQSKSRHWSNELVFSPIFRNTTIVLGTVLIAIGIHLYNQPSEDSQFNSFLRADLTNDEVVEYLVNNPNAVMQLEELYEGEISNVGYSEEEIIEQTSADEIEEIITDL